MPYRDPSFSRRGPAAVADLRGRSPAGASPLVAIVMGVVAAIGAGRWSGSWLAGIGVGCAAVLLFFRLDRRSRRFRLAVRADHVHLRHYLLGFLPLPAQRIPLEWSVGRNDDPEYSPSDGIIFSTPPWSRDFDVVCFGPTDDATANPLAAEIAARMEEARRTLSAGDAGREQRRGSGDLFPLFRALDPASIERNAWGRASRAVLRADAEFAGVTLASGSTLHMARTDVWLAPGTPDRIASVELAARTRLRALGRTLRAGATLHWNDARALTRIERGFDGEVELGGFRADGGKDLHFEDGGQLWGFTTAVPLRIADLEVPAGTRIEAGGWSLTLLPPEGSGDDLRAYHFTTTAPVERSGLAKILRDPRQHLRPHGQRCSKDRRHTPVRLWSE